MKKLVSMILTGVLVLSLAGCGSTNTASDVAESTTVAVEAETTAETESSEVVISEEEVAQAESATKRTFVDDAGVEMEVPEKIDRIVVGSWQMVGPLAVYLGGGEKIVGMAPASLKAAENGILGEMYPELLNAETDFYNGGDINMEELLKLDPDLVIGVSEEKAEAIRAAGIPATVVSVSKWNYDVIETYSHWLETFDAIFGGSAYEGDVTEYSRQVQASIQEKVSTIAEEDRKRVMILFSYSDATMTTSSKIFFGQSWCDLTGAINVGEGIESLGNAAINMEQVYEWNPDVIIITNFTKAQPEDLYNNTIGSDDWSSINAVKNKQVYKMPLGVYRSFTPGADTPVTLQWFAKAVYPELFADIDVEQVARDYYKDFYNIELTDEQVENMFNPPSAASAN
ncbi:MAG: ABC transporter substrate-binding protein [Lachnospiraceae bacterium]|nr:ABC transporter substrate-binding protein [Lachnospiraceae bacterium]